MEKTELDEKSLNYCKANAEEDYLKTPISVLRYISALEKELNWYNLYVDQVQMSNHRQHEYACEYADEETGEIDYPYSEGDDYWTVEELKGKEYEDSTGVFQNGILAVQSCWDDQSEEFHREDPDREYFDNLDEILNYAQYRYDFIKLSFYAPDKYTECFDVKDGGYMVAMDDDCSKFQTSY